jgi:thiopurine S-methyltransferase
MEAEFWHDCWERGRLGFHQPDYNRHMTTFMPRLGLQPGAHVLVPLCGKSLDMLWLAGQGFSVTGIELSRKAVGDFFVENSLDFETRDIDGATAYRHGKLEILCTDLFEYSLESLTPVDAVYDRAALPALPATMRRDYAGLMLDHLPLNTVMLLQAKEYPQYEMEGPPFSVAPAEIEALYGLCCTIEPLYSRECLHQRPHWKEKGLSHLLDHVYKITKTRN